MATSPAGYKASGLGCNTGLKCSTVWSAVCMLAESGEVTPCMCASHPGQWTHACVYHTQASGPMHACAWQSLLRWERVAQVSPGGCTYQHPFMLYAVAASLLKRTCQCAVDILVFDGCVGGCRGRRSSLLWWRPAPGARRRRTFTWARRGWASTRGWGLARRRRALLLGRRRGCGNVLKARIIWKGENP